MFCFVSVALVLYSWDGPPNEARQECSMRGSCPSVASNVDLRKARGMISSNLPWQVGRWGAVWHSHHIRFFLA